MQWRFSHPRPRGPNDGTQNVLNIQPVIPITINPDWNLITRTIIPLIWGAGPIIQFPATTNDLGNENWGLGPSARSSTSGSGR